MNQNRSNLLRNFNFKKRKEKNQQRRQTRSISQESLCKISFDDNCHHKRRRRRTRNHDNVISQPFISTIVVFLSSVSSVIATLHLSDRNKPWLGSGKISVWKKCHFCGEKPNCQDKILSDHIFLCSFLGSKDLKKSRFPASKRKIPNFRLLSERSDGSLPYF